MATFVQAGMQASNTRELEREILRLRHERDELKRSTNIFQSQIEELQRKNKEAKEVIQDIWPPRW